LLLLGTINPRFKGIEKRNGYIDCSNVQKKVTYSKLDDLGLQEELHIDDEIPTTAPERSATCDEG
jgi:hypothetical protein